MVAPSSLIPAMLLLNSQNLCQAAETLQVYTLQYNIIVMLNLSSILSQKEQHPRTIRSKSSTVTQLRNSTSYFMNRSFMSRSSDQAYKSEAVFMVRKPFSNGVFDFSSHSNNQNVFRRDNNVIVQSEKEAIRRRAYSASNVRKLKIQRNIHIDKKVIPVPLIQNCSQILASFSQHQVANNKKQIQSKRPLYRRSKKCRLAIQRFDLKSKQLARIQGLTGIKIV